MRAPRVLFVLLGLTAAGPAAHAQATAEPCPPGLSKVTVTREARLGGPFISAHLAGFGDGMPLQGAQLYVRALDVAAPAERISRTDASGYAAPLQVEAGRYFVIGRAV